MFGVEEKNIVVAAPFDRNHTLSSLRRRSLANTTIIKRKRTKSRHCKRQITKKAERSSLFSSSTRQPRHSVHQQQKTTTMTNAPCYHHFFLPDSTVVGAFERGKYRFVFAETSWARVDATMPNGPLLYNIIFFPENDFNARDDLRKAK